MQDAYYPRVYDFGNLYAGFIKARRGKRNKQSVAKFEANLGIWDYSNQPGNVMGQICPLYGLLWFFIMPLAIWAEDTARWLIWAYECAVHGKTAKPPDLAPYSLKSVYSDFLHGR